MSKREREFEDLLKTAEIKDYFFRVERDMFPKMKQSAMSLTIIDSKPDAKLCLEVGAAVLFDKPILVCAIKGSKVPENLRRCAHSIVEVSGLQTEEDRKKVQAAVERMMRGKASAE